MWISGLEYPILHESIKMSADASRRDLQAFR
jgi:hypothetical protein